MEVQPPYRLLTEDEIRSKKYVDGRSEYWDSYRWCRAGHQPSPGNPYRAPAGHNPQGLTIIEIGLPVFRCLEKEELDGRWAAQAEMFENGKWFTAYGASQPDLTYRLDISKYGEYNPETSVHYNEGKPKPKEEIVVEYPFRKLTKEEVRSGLYTNGMSEYFATGRKEWVKSGCTPSADTLTYRIRLDYQNPEEPAVDDPTKIEPPYRKVLLNEIDGRYSNGRCEFWDKDEKKWAPSRQANTVELIYRVSTAIHNPEQFYDSKIDVVNYRHLRKDELDGRWKNKAQYYSSSLVKWNTSVTADDIGVTYRLDRKLYGEYGQITPPVQPSTSPIESVSCPQDFKTRFFTRDEAVVVMGPLRTENDIETILKAWNAKQIPGTTNYRILEPEVIPELKDRDKLPSVFSEVDMERTFGYTKSRELMYNFVIVKVPGTDALTFAPEKEADPFEGKNQKLNPMFTVQEACDAGMTYSDINALLSLEKIRKIPGVEAYEYTF